MAKLECTVRVSTAGLRAELARAERHIRRVAGRGGAEVDVVVRDDEAGGFVILADGHAAYSISTRFSDGELQFRGGPVG